MEALAALGTPRACEALKAASKSKDHEVRAAVTEYAPELVSEMDRSASLIKALERAGLYSGLSQTLDQVEDFHPPEVVEALFRGALRREGEIAVNFAAMLMLMDELASGSSRAFSGALLHHRAQLADARLSPQKSYESERPKVLPRR